jgi:hypothetical protein
VGCDVWRPLPIRNSVADLELSVFAPYNVEEGRKWRSATSYMERYVAKPEQFPEGVETGRVWGVWGKNLLPVTWETVKVSIKDTYKTRRVYRRLAKMRGKGSPPSHGLREVRERAHVA